MRVTKEIRPALVRSVLHQLDARAEAQERNGENRERQMTYSYVLVTLLQADHGLSNSQANTLLKTMREEGSIAGKKGRGGTWLYTTPERWKEITDEKERNEAIIAEQIEMSAEQVTRLATAGIIALQNQSRYTARKLPGIILLPEDAEKLLEKAGL